MILGIVLSLCAALGFGTSAVLARSGMRHVGSSTATFISLVSSTLIAVLVAFTFHTPEILTLPIGVFLWFLLAGTINFPGGRLMNFTSIRLIGASKSAVIISTSPLFAGAIAIVFSNESINVLVAIGTFFIIAGIMLVVTKR